LKMAIRFEGRAREVFKERKKIYYIVLNADVNITSGPSEVKRKKEKNGYFCNLVFLTA
jgi:hypothetical protein